MEFTFDINALFAQDITRIAGNAPFVHRHSSTKWDCSPSEKNFATVIDAIGAASAKAQGLHTVITTAQKFRSSNQALYIMKDGACNSGKGAAVGIIKVGRKVLFLADTSGALHEVEPVCVLDFYVHESRQRTGCGKKLFEAMLEAEQKKPFELAIDRPSPKFLGFLRKHYNLQSHVKQANNFVVFEQFFTTCVARGSSNRRHSLQKGSILPSSLEPLTTSPHANMSAAGGGGTGGPVVHRVPAGSAWGPVARLHSNQPAQNSQQTALQPCNLEGSSVTPLTTAPSKLGGCGGQESTHTLEVATTNDFTGFASTTSDEPFGRLDPSKAPYLNMRNPGDKRRGRGTAEVDWFNCSSLVPPHYATGVPAVLNTTRYSRHQACDPDPLKRGGVPPASSLAQGLYQNNEVPRGTQRKTWRSYIT